MTDDVITLRNHLRVGAQNALRRWQLCEMTGWTDRHLRKVIEAAFTPLTSASRWR